MRNRVILHRGSPSSPEPASTPVFRGWMHAFVRTLASLCLIVWAPCVLAHATLTASEPAHGMVLSTLPGSVSLQFNESVAPLVFRIAGPDGIFRQVSQIRQNGH